jgi:hypothetical protein
LHGDEIALDRAFVHRGPRGALFAHLFQHLAHVLVGHRALAACDPEPVHPGEVDLRSDLDVQVESEWLAFVELEIVDVRLCRDLEVLALENRLVGLLHEVLDRLLADRVGETLEYHLRGRFPGAEAGQPHFGCITTRGALGGSAYLVRVDRDLEQPLGALGLLGGDLDVHASQEFNIGPRGSKSAARRLPHVVESSWPGLSGNLDPKR